MKKQITTQKTVFSVFLLFSAFLPLLCPAFAQKTLDYDFTYARFCGNDTLTMVETYYQIPLKQIEYVLEGAQHKLGLKIDLKICSGDSIFLNQSLEYPFFTATDMPDTRDELIPIARNFFIGPGDYELTTKVSDLYGEASKEIKMPLVISNFVSNKLNFSDILLSNSISPDTVKDDYYKNGMKVLPNSAKTFGPTAPNLFFYAELYNLYFSENSQNPDYVISRRIRDTENQIIMELPEKTKAKPGASSVEVGRFEVSSLYTGQYFLEIEATDLATKQTSSAIQLFSIDNPEKIVSAMEESKPAETNNELYPDSRYDIMVEEELDLEFEMAKYIADRKEKRAYKKLQVEEKRNFLKEFWTKRDSDPSTELNEFRVGYLSRAKYVNETLGNMGEGWKTDRGRVILLYGFADEVERFTLTSQSKPYQIWHYYSTEGGVEFIFVDKRNFGNFELVHSTARREIYDKDWVRWVFINTDNRSLNQYGQELKDAADAEAAALEATME